MTTKRKPTRRDFPVLWTPAEYRKVFRNRPYSVCPCCHLAVDCRNRNRHVKACMARKRNAPELWREWQTAMRQPTPTRRTP